LHLVREVYFFGKSSAYPTLCTTNKSTGEVWAKKRRKREYKGIPQVGVGVQFVRHKTARLSILSVLGFLPETDREALAKLPIG